MSAQSAGAATPHHKIRAGRFRYDKDLECMVEIRPGSNYFDLHELRSDFPSPAIRPDALPRAIKSMVSGKMHDGKSAYYREVSRAGCEIVGFDKDWESHIKGPQPFGGDKAHTADLVADIKRASQEEASKMPPAGGVEDRRLMKAQRRRARASKC